jgi:DivIVA domain-containing protein
MSATDLDLPVLITAEQIRVREFVTTRRGYDPGQVRDYLVALAEQIDLMASMIREARMDADAALRAQDGPKIDPYEQLARRVAGVIREADEAAERARLDGRRDAERLMAEARADAERIRVDAQATAEAARQQADRALADAKQQADRTIAGLSSRRDALVDQLAVMQERLLGVARDLEATIVAPELAAAPDPEMVPASPMPTSSRDDAASIAARDEAESEIDASSEIVDVRHTEPSPNLPSAPLSIEELFADLDTHDDLWDGTQAMQLEVPDIPALDLDWGDAGIDEDDDRF